MTTPLPPSRSGGAQPTLLGQRRHRPARHAITVVVLAALLPVSFFPFLLLADRGSSIRRFGGAPNHLLVGPGKSHSSSRRSNVVGGLGTAASTSAARAEPEAAKAFSSSSSYSSDAAWTAPGASSSAAAGAGGAAAATPAPHPHAGARGADGRFGYVADVTYVRRRGRRRRRRRRRESPSGAGLLRSPEVDPICDGEGTREWIRRREGTDEWRYFRERLRVFDDVDVDDDGRKRRPPRLLCLVCTHSKSREKLRAIVDTWAASSPPPTSSSSSSSSEEEED